jgi:hypothetical protein
LWYSINKGGKWYENIYKRSGICWRVGIG